MMERQCRRCLRLVIRLLALRLYVRLAVVSVPVLILGCSAAPTDQALSDSAFSQGKGSQWIQFGVLLAVQRVQLVGAEGALEPGMRMEVVLDDGRSVVVEQPLSQAGELSSGNRVRLLQIGSYSQVTFWPYQQGSEDEPVNAAPGVP